MESMVAQLALDKASKAHIYDSEAYPIAFE